ncbi:MAG: NfeD family protein [Alphaproteobacteria bacterium]|nr:NfeD family protein [Alphaproteobacteria bacterium]
MNEFANNYFAEISFWHWLIAGVILIVLEIILPGVFFLWLGLGAIVTGFIAMLMPYLSWEVQFVIFAILGVACAFAGKRFYSKTEKPTDHPNLSQRAAQYVGKTYALIEPIKNGRGKIHVGATEWRVEGDDLPKETLVTVTGYDATTLKVEKAEERS